MLTGDQADVIEFLAAPSAHGTATVDRIDTHSAIVFLAGDRAYKLKRAVRFDYLDFSTVERRGAMCDAEVRLNRRTAPDIYRGVVPITREPGGTLALGGSGAPIDWAVEKNRFSQEALFDRLAGSVSRPMSGCRSLASGSKHRKRPSSHVWKQRHNDVSDADAAVIRLQHRDGTGVMEWHRVEASRTPGAVVDEALTRVREFAPDAMARNLSS
jgi:hypothetical protein